MHTLIEGYRNLPGAHCGSTAMRNLLFHHCGLELSEESVFGLGAGPDLLYLRSDTVEPAVLLFGRNLTMEVDAGRALALDYREQPDLDDEHAWQVVRAEVAAGRPTMLSGDAFYLPYRDFRVHFPSHRFVLLGFDDERAEAIVADRLDPEPQRCPLAALRQSRNPPEFVSTFNLWGKFHGSVPGRSLADAYADALARAARRMLGEDQAALLLLKVLARGRPVEASVGLRAIRELADDLPGWAARADLPKIAGFAWQCIEKYGTGGGNFRTMYAHFLHEARDLLGERVDARAPDLAARSAAAWTELAGLLAPLAGDPGADPAPILAACAAVLRRVLALETELFERLANQPATS